MALYIDTEETPFHLQTNKFAAMKQNNLFLSAKTVQADGDELMFILDNFKNIPSCTARVQRWTGETAKFILEHLAWI